MTTERKLNIFSLDTLVPLTLVLTIGGSVVGVLLAYNGLTTEFKVEKAINENFRTQTQSRLSKNESDIGEIKSDFVKKIDELKSDVNSMKFILVKFAVKLDVNIDDAPVTTTLINADL